ncbi:hypothetical protein SEA_EASTWEST_69 [Arthrobacter phage EastWest]|uniref:Uncharacterized protein n=1 Tax=Arthrobacter phage EastWest TaxID=2894292 RepID=A0AAE9C9P1_9CAUD|nr:hypothetical protein SEA_EASTWEST_69 [Arthrobacter phage EastWest]
MSKQLQEYFVGGWLDGQTQPYEPNVPPQVVAHDAVQGVLDVYVRQPAFDTETTRYWVRVEDPTDMLSQRSYQQGALQGRKHLTLNELRAFVQVTDAMGFPPDTPIRGKINWTGTVSQLAVSRDDVESDKGEKQ